MKSISDNLEKIERNIVLDTDNPAIFGGFTQVPNFILEDPKLSEGGKVVYGLFLRYAWENDFCFPGQDTLAKHLGKSVSTANRYVADCKNRGYVEITRRGQGKVNIYTLKFNVQRDWRNSKKSGDK